MGWRRLPYARPDGADIHRGSHSRDGLPVRAMTDTDDFATWIDCQVSHSVHAMTRAISATSLCRERAAFGQSVRPAPGSVLASVQVADWDPEPDYFFHWVRDSAIVMRVVAELMEDAPNAHERAAWQHRFEAFIRFSATIADTGYASSTPLATVRARTAPGRRHLLRSVQDMRTLRGDKLRGEPRFNADGTLDFLRWSRPQYDGPALRALASLRYLAAGGRRWPLFDDLLRRDLGFTLRHAGQRSIGPWEEPDERSHHYYVALVQLGALVHGQAWLQGRAAQRARAEARLRSRLRAHLHTGGQVYAAIAGSPGPVREVIDAACILAVLDADLPNGPHSVLDPCAQATLAALDALFRDEFPLNHALPPHRAPAFGRSRADRYFGGGAWYVTTLAAAAFFYRLAARDPGHAAPWFRRGDAFMATVRALIPIDGSLSEQVDRATGKPVSARDLTWSHAAFISTARLRRTAQRALHAR